MCNTYYPLLQPRAKVVAGVVGVVQLYREEGQAPDNHFGGFQVFSLAYGLVHKLLSGGGAQACVSLGGGGGKRGTRGGAGAPLRHSLFRSYLSGREFLLTPESTVLPGFHPVWYSTLIDGFNYFLPQFQAHVIPCLIQTRILMCLATRVVVSPQMLWVC